jgi:spore maturation protein CgeB
LSRASLDILIFGLSITSAWGNGHATTYRALTRALSERGHRVRFFERDVPWYARARDLPCPSYAGTRLYTRLEELEACFAGEVRADLTIIGSYVPDAIRLAHWLLPRATGLTAFYDIDTPVTLAGLDRGECPYLTPALASRFDLYLSFAGGPALERLRTVYGVRRAVPLYCSVDPRDYFPTRTKKRYDLGYLGTYSPDRQPALERLLLEPAARWPAGRFSVAGALYPESIAWPLNVTRIEHLAPDVHRGYYNSQRFTLSISRADMLASGYSPSVRLFEAAACGVPIISDAWPGTSQFLTPGREILVASCAAEVLHFLHDLPAEQLARVARRARERVMRSHTGAHRAVQLESYVRDALAGRAPAAGTAVARHRPAEA